MIQRILIPVDPLISVKGYTAGYCVDCMPSSDVRFNIRMEMLFRSSVKYSHVPFQIYEILMKFSLKYILMNKVVIKCHYC